MVNFTKIARIVIAVLFIFSSVSKIVSISFFDGLVSELLLGKDYFNYPSKLWWIQLTTRTLIVIELILGIAILQKKLLLKLTLPAIQAMLILFTIHLIYEGTQKGFVDGNCGCFGDVLPMTILESIIKNVVAFILGLYVWKRFKKDKREHQFASWTGLTVLGIVSFITLFMGIKDYGNNGVTPIKNDTLNYPEEIPEDSLNLESIDTSESIEYIDTIIDVEPVKTTDTSKQDKPAPSNTPAQITKQKLIKYSNFSGGKKLNLEKGEKLICMFSMTCSHCQEVIRDICEAKNDGGMPEVYLFNYGSEFEQNYFFSQGGGCSYPYYRMENYAEFKKLLEGEDFPRMLVFKNGKITKSWNVSSYTRESLRKYFQIKKKVKVEDPLNTKRKGSGFGSGNGGW